MNAPPSAEITVPPEPLPAWNGAMLARINLLLLAGCATALVVLLWPHWRGNPDLSHGFLTPLLFLLLVREARSGTRRYLPPSPLARGVICAGLIGALLLFAVGGLYAAALDWSHSLVAFVLTGSFAVLLSAAFVGFADTRVRIIPLNWSAVVAIAVWLLSAPIPPGTYTRLMLGLQFAVTENVLRALHLLGIAAQRHGNVIELATTSVGVEEACSGIRSLVACVLAGFFFSATLVRKPWSRAIVIGLAAPVAIGMNFVRSLILTLLANAGVDINGRWHDLTGFAVLAVTAALLAGLAVLLERPSRHTSSSGPASRSEPSPPPAAEIPLPHHQASAPRSAQLPLTAALGCAIVLAVILLAMTRPSVRQGMPPPDLLRLLPAESPGWHVQTSSDLFRFSATLHTEHLAQRTYTRMADGRPEQITIYLAYWPAGQAPVSLVASHTPDACWPGSGWKSVALRSADNDVTPTRRTSAPPESRLFVSGQRTQYVWFWHLYDGRPIAHREPRSPRALLRIAWEHGFSHNGDQLFVRVSSNRPWEELGAEPLLTEVLGRLQPFGL